MVRKSTTISTTTSAGVHVESECTRRCFSYCSRAAAARRVGLVGKQLTYLTGFAGVVAVQ
jgi:hypothetical protein